MYIRKVLVFKIVEFVIEPVVFLKKKQQAREAAFVRKFSSQI